MYEADSASTVAPMRGMLPRGEFSVSETQKVHFSKGNLQYQASTNTWRFAEHQYDTIGIGNRNISFTLLTADGKRYMLVKKKKNHVGGSSFFAHNRF